MPAKNRPKPLARIPGASTRSLLFAPDGQLVVNVSDGWLAIDVEKSRTRVLPVTGGSGVFFGRWLLVRNHDSDVTRAMDWSSTSDDVETHDCEIGFDLDYGFRANSLAAAGSSISAFVRGGRICVRRGAPDTLSDRKGWEYVAPTSANLQVVVSSDDRFVVGANYGGDADIFDTTTRKVRKVHLETHGHPHWCAAHPSSPRMLMCSRVLHEIDLVSGNHKVLYEVEGSGKPLGEYLPDGSIVATTEQGLLVLTTDGQGLIKHEGHDDRYPARVSRDGQYVALWNDGVEIFRTSDLLGR
jgi:hypothetical protein